MPKTKQKTGYIFKISDLYIVFGVVLILFTMAYAVNYYHYKAVPIPSRTSRSVSVIAEWMTTNYISRTYQVPEKLLLDTTGVTQQVASHRNLKSLAKLKHISSTELLDKLRVVISQYQNQAK